MKAVMLFAFVAAVLVAGCLMFDSGDWGEPKE